MAGIPITRIYRPRMLIGNKNKSRQTELIAQKLSFTFDFLTLGSMRKYNSVKTDYLAKKVVGKSMNVNIKESTIQIHSFE